MADFVNDYLAGNPQSTVMIRYLLFLRKIGFNPRVVYDVGAFNTSFANLVNEIFPDTRVILFDACKDNASKMVGYEHYNCCLGNTDREVDFYELDDKIKSYYKPKTFDDAKNTRTTRVKIEKLDDVVMKYGLPFPDLVRIDCCGSEKDVIGGCMSTLQLSKYLIVNMQNEEVFLEGATAIETGPLIKSLGYVVKDVLDLYGTPLIDYVFENKSL
jgi:FkbM family methyltransferase